MTFAAVLILSPDALLVRLIRCDVWTLLFWRCLLTSAMQAVFLGLRYRRQFVQSFHNTGRTGLLSAAIVGSGSLMFVNSLKHTAAANTLIILAATPLISSLLSWLFLREKIARRTWIAIFICFGGILLIFSGSLQSGFLLGDLLALGATFMWGSNLVVIRSGKSVNMIPANLLGNLLVVPAALLAGAQPASVATPDITFLLLLGGIVSWWVTTRSKDEKLNSARFSRGTLIASGFIASRFLAVSTRVSPLTMLLVEAEMLTVSALSLFAAISKDVLVLVLGS